MRSESFMLWALAMFLLMSARMFQVIVPGSSLVLVFGGGSMIASVFIIVEDILHRRGAYKKRRLRLDE